MYIKIFIQICKDMREKNLDKITSNRKVDFNISNLNGIVFIFINNII